MKYKIKGCFLSQGMRAEEHKDLFYKLCTRYKVDLTSIRQNLYTNFTFKISCSEKDLYTFVEDLQKCRFEILSIKKVLW